jgi:mono/diheme cytochrome c family protein
MNLPKPMNRPNPRSLALRLTTICACAIMLASAGCKSAPGKPGAEPEVARPEQVLDFTTLYRQNCASCHGVIGQNGVAISLGNPVYLATAGVANIQRITANGVPGTAMPPFGKAAGGMLTDQQIALLAQGMVALWGRPSVLSGQTPPTFASSSHGDPVQGKKTFANFCARCHGTDATGANLGNGTVTGSLVDPAYLALISDQGLRSIIIAGKPEQGMPDWRSRQSGPGARTMTEQEISDTVAWLGSHRIATPGQPYQQHP